MKRHLVAFAILASAGPAAADASLSETLGEASACSDAVLQDYAARTCESPETIAARAVAKCRDKWNAVADRAFGAASAKTSSRERARSLKIYSDAMENEYTQAAELKAIDIRRAGGGACDAE